VVYGNLAVVGMRFHGVVNFLPSAVRMFQVVKCGYRCGCNPHFTHAHAICAHLHLTVTI